MGIWRCDGCFDYHKKQQSYDTMLGLLPLLPNASLLPMFPKQTQLQNSTLAIHVLTPILSLVIRPSDRMPSKEELPAFARGIGVAGEGTISGFTPSSTTVPAIPTIADRKKPGFERSTRYHKTGFTSASVRDTCKVDCQGSLRLEFRQLVFL